MRSFMAGFTKPGNAILSSWSWLLKLTQHLADRGVVDSCLHDQVTRNLQGTNRSFTNACSIASGIFAPCSRSVSTWNSHLDGFHEVPSMEDGKPVEPLLEDISQLILVLGLKFSVLGVLNAPLLRLHLCASENQKITVVERIRGSRSLAGGTARCCVAFLQMVLQPLPKAFVQMVRLLGQDQNR